MSEKIVLKTINELLGEHFYLCYYQRGYRWTDHQVNNLLDDIWNFANSPKTDNNDFYCLQPIVVKEKYWDENGTNIKGWELIDGQQRLTSIYIILSYLAKEFLKVNSLVEDYGKEVYSLRYETRENSEKYLKNIQENYSNIDYHHIYKAYLTVEEWFNNSDKIKDRSDKNKFLSILLGKEKDEKSVKIIWYEVENHMNSLDLFSRLNIGKIPLTNSELIKALFLSSSSFMTEADKDAQKMKIEISLLWDEMEQRLSEINFWSFITNNSLDNYANKIELLFDMISNKNEKNRDPLYTFIYFNDLSKLEYLWGIWLQIEQYYQTLNEWFKNRDLYHKIGYLVYIGKNLKELVKKSLETPKNEFMNEVDALIKNSIKFDIDELSYDKDSDKQKIDKVLMLFNVESTRKNKNINEYYPFKYHKSDDWSLEHIHAQNSESLDKNKKEKWKDWLDYHKNILNDMIIDSDDVTRKNELISMMSEINAVDLTKYNWNKFTDMSERIIKLFTKDEDSENMDMHNINNLALLRAKENSALNNSIFEVKRRKIIEMDKKGEYLPLCTRRVFLKYYNDKAGSDNHYIWSRMDRISYLFEIKRILAEYLPNNLEMEQ